MDFMKNEKKIIQKVVTGGAIINNNKILILQRAKDEDAFPNIWELPGGKKEPFEFVYDSVVREVREETGLIVKVLNLLSAFNYKVEKEEELRDMTQIDFLIEPVDKIEVKISDEHQDFKWVGEEELDNYEITEETKSVIRKAFKNLKK